VIEYFVSCILLGLGIAIDVALATVGMARLLRDPAVRSFWVRNVTAAHIVLPMIGYYGFAAIAQLAPQSHVLLGLLASGLVLWFLASQLRDWLQDFEATDPRRISLFAVLAVSWDALWSGPAKSAQALTWTALETAASFFVAGGIVAAIAILAAHLAPLILDRLQSNLGIRRLAWQEVVAQWLEFSVIAFFGTLSFVRYVLHSDISEWLLLASVCSVTLVLWLPLAQRLHRQRFYALAQLNSR
jgi:hypothetical protein